MSEKNLRCSSIFENYIPPNITEELLHNVCESVADAFLGQIEYGKDYVIRTKLVKEDWANGFGTKYTYNLIFDELIRCRDCRFKAGDGDWCCRTDHEFVIDPDDFCSLGKRRDA